MKCLSFFLSFYIYMGNTKKETPDLFADLWKVSMWMTLQLEATANVMHFTFTRKPETERSREDLFCENGKATVRN